MTNERANTLGLEHRDYAQDVHFREAHSMATTKQKDDASISGTTWLVELAFAASYGPTDRGTTCEARFRRDNIYHVAATVKLNLHSGSRQIFDENKAWRAIPASCVP